MTKGHWIQTEIEDREITYSHEKHSPVPLKGTPWMYCKYCGLVYLKNRITRWCIRMGCNSDYHPQFKTMLNRFSK